MTPATEPTPAERLAAAGWTYVAEGRWRAPGTTEVVTERQALARLRPRRPDPRRHTTDDRTDGPL